MFCEKCGAKFEEGTRFCPFCGWAQNEASGETTVLNQQEFQNTAQTGYDAQVPNNDQPQVPYQAPADYNYQQYPQPPKKKGGLKWWHILLIVLGLLLVIFLVVGIIASKSEEDDSFRVNEVSSTEDSTLIEKKFDYTKGQIEGNYYVNEWANLKLEITDDFPDTPDRYSEFAANKIDVGFVSSDRVTSKQLLIRFEKLDQLPVLSVSDKVLNEYVDSFINNSKREYENLGFNVSVDSPVDKIIAGNTYKMVKFKIENSTFEEEVCIRIVDKHAIVIDIASLDSNDFDVAFSLFSQVD